MTIPARHTSMHKSDGSPVLEGVEVAKIWSPDVDRSMMCWPPATAATLANESWHAPSWKTGSKTILRLFAYTTESACRVYAESAITSVTEMRWTSAFNHNKRSWSDLFFKHKFILEI
ncbi:hypothetical protein Y032_1049g3491 [Ancylostoma ceylanicum]|uniref:Uncharacterized protein n=1 Tax=Ancylostoma ceylanicum TaxID=53326 RepID=A0A016W795_9BILA|nr:hypothetical protein Y032_1049g3491 [Ancylostoma ceylanicum]